MSQESSPISNQRLLDLMLWVLLVIFYNIFGPDGDDTYLFITLEIWINLFASIVWYDALVHSVNNFIKRGHIAIYLSRLGEL